MGESDREIFLREEMRDAESKQACLGRYMQARKSGVRTDGLLLLSITVFFLAHLTKIKAEPLLIIK